MSTWKDEFDRRCRRILGVTDDTQPVTVEVDGGTQQWSEWTVEEAGWVIVTVGKQSQVFDDMGELIRKLDEVEL